MKGTGEVRKHISSEEGDLGECGKCSREKVEEVRNTETGAYLPCKASTGRCYTGDFLTCMASRLHQIVRPEGLVSKQAVTLCAFKESKKREAVPHQRAAAQKERFAQKREIWLCSLAETLPALRLNKKQCTAMFRLACSVLAECM